MRSWREWQLWAMCGSREMSVEDSGQRESGLSVVQSHHWSYYSEAAYVLAAMTLSIYLMCKQVTPEQISSKFPMNLPAPTSKMDPMNFQIVKARPN